MDLSNPLQLVLHGSITLAITLLAGFLYGRHLGTTQADKERAWKLVHVAGTMGGMSLLLVAGIEDMLVVSTTFIAWLNGIFLVANYAFLSGMILAAVSGQRGLDPGGSPANQAVFSLYTLAVVASLVVVAMLLIGSARSL